MPWQYPVLSVEVYENGEYYQTTLDGRPIKTDKYLAPLEKFVAHYPEKPDLEDEINRLPLLYRPGLKALLYLKLRKPADKSYLSLLLWLNQAAAKVYKRYNAIRLSYSAVFTASAVIALATAALSSLIAVASAPTSPRSGSAILTDSNLSL